MSSGVTPADRPNLGVVHSRPSLCSLGVSNGKVAPRVSGSDAVTCGAGCVLCDVRKDRLPGRAGNGDGENSGKIKVMIEMHLRMLCHTR